MQGRGAAAFVITGVIDNGGKFENKIIGARSILLSTTCSAFNAEVTALDTATSYLAELVQLS